MAKAHYDTPWKVTQPVNIVIQLSDKLDFFSDVACFDTK